MAVSYYSPARLYAVGISRVVPFRPWPPYERKARAPPVHPSAASPQAGGGSASAAHPAPWQPVVGSWRLPSALWPCQHCDPMLLVAIPAQLQGLPCSLPRCSGPSRLMREHHDGTQAPGHSQIPSSSHAPPAAPTASSLPDPVSACPPPRLDLRPPRPHPWDESHGPHGQHCLQRHWRP